MEMKQIEEMIQLAKNYGLAEFEYETDEQRVYFSFPVAGEVAVPAAKAPAAPVAAPVVESTKESAMSEGNTITSPLVGTFYAAPGEDQPPFVKVGDTVKKGQVLCIVEAMKLMNNIESEYNGVVKEILVENGNVVEFGQPLFVIG